MAEGWTKKLHSDIEPYSAGIAKHDLSPSEVEKPAIYRQVGDEIKDFLRTLPEILV
jgi:hypothetical protein